MTSKRKLPKINTFIRIKVEVSIDQNECLVFSITSKQFYFVLLSCLYKMKGIFGQQIRKFCWAYPFIKNVLISNCL